MANEGPPRLPALARVAAPLQPHNPPESMGDVSFLIHCTPSTPRTPHAAATLQTATIEQNNVLLFIFSHLSSASFLQDGYLHYGPSTSTAAHVNPRAASPAFDDISENSHSSHRGLAVAAVTPAGHLAARSEFTDHSAHASDENLGTKGHQVGQPIGLLAARGASSTLSPSIRYSCTDATIHRHSLRQETAVPIKKMQDFMSNSRSHHSHRQSPLLPILQWLRLDSGTQR